MGNFVYDKKQLPQVIALGTLSVGLFGFFGFKMVTPPPTSAAPPPARAAASAPAVPAANTASTPASAASGAPAADATLSATDTAAFIGAEPPSSAMRDPFTPGMGPAPVPPKPVQVASATLPSAPPVPGLPSMGQVRPLSLPGGMPAAQPAEWTVTGVICSDLDPASSIAILRLGDERRYVRLGSMIDDSTKLIGVDRNGVTILRSNSRIRLGLGGPLSQPKSRTAGTLNNGYGGTIGAPASAPSASPAPTIAAPTLPSIS